MFKNFICFCCSLITVFQVCGQDPLWLRYPAISPDGKTIVFSYKGDIWRVPASGGSAVPLTLHEAHDYMPVWSHDGKTIAFASDRFGNFDIYTMPASGGQAKRITFNSARDIPWAFSPDDKYVYFGSGRNDIASSVRYPINGIFPKLFKVPTDGGRSLLVSSAGMEEVTLSSKGDKIFYQDRKGYEDPLRKHHHSSIARDIWVYDVKKNEYNKILQNDYEDREPVIGSDDQTVFYLRESKGESQNLYRMSLTDKKEQKLTSFKDHPIRHLTRADDNTLCFTWKGEIYTLVPGQSAKKVSIGLNSDSRLNNERVVSVNGGANEFEVSPNGKEVAFIFRGEVFVTSIEGGITKRITNTPQQERYVVFSPDGRTLYYGAERNDNWDIYKTSISRKDEPYFYASTILSEEPVISTAKEEFQPEISPDGKEIAYLEDRNTIKVYNLASKISRVIQPPGQTFSYADGDHFFSWSPDSKWIVARTSQGLIYSSDLMLYKADGSESVNVTHSGFYDYSPKFAMSGKAMIWATDRDGRKSLANQGSREVDVYAMFFDKDTYDRFKLSKEDFNLLKEKEEKDAKEKKDTSKKTVVFNPDLASVDMRKIKLTNGSLNLGSFMLSPAGDKLYFTAKFEQGYDVWVLDTRTRELRSGGRLSAGYIALSATPDGKTIVAMHDGRLSKIDPEQARITPITVNGEMLLNTASERNYIFEHAWRQIKEKFYDPKLHGIDWDMYKKVYATYLPHINNNYDFTEMLSEMMGELNASHTGSSYYPQPVNPDVTAALGMLYDESTGGAGLKIAEVIDGGAVDKSISKIRKGNIIEKIDGNPIDDSIDWASLLNRKANKNVLLSIYDPVSNERWEETVKPISSGAESALLYKRWVKKMSAMVDSMSGGQLGYVHIPTMDDGNFRTLYEEVLGSNAKKKALIVDTRFNNGGNLHEDLLNFLEAKQYVKFNAYGTPSESGEPLNRWYKPSIVLMSESNYSDAHAFPYAYRAKQVGKLVGMPVPGTSTSVWWEYQIDPTVMFGVPMIAFVDMKTDKPLENTELEPDIKVWNSYNALLGGKDEQLEAAVKEMLRAINEKK